MTTVLLIDNDMVASGAIAAALKAAGYQAATVSSASSAIVSIASSLPEAIVIGLDVASEIDALADYFRAREAARQLPTVITACCAKALTNVLTGPVEQLPKPIESGVLLRSLKRLRECADLAARQHDTAHAPVAAKEMERQLVRRLSSETVRIQEEERRKLSLELHDDIAQILGNLVLMIDTCLTIAPPDASQLRRHLSTARETAKDGFRRVQRFSLELRPPMLDDLGLAPTISWWAERFSRDSEISVSVSIPDRLPSLNGEQETSLFRILQEALHNIRKHARAKRATVALEQRGGNLRLAIWDDGAGFDPALIDEKMAEGTHVGLAGMRYRAELLGGSFEITTASELGTCVLVEIPVAVGTRANGPLNDLLDRDVVERQGVQAREGAKGNTDGSVYQSIGG